MIQNILCNWNGNWLSLKHKISEDQEYRYIHPNTRINLYLIILYFVHYYMKYIFKARYKLNILNHIINNLMCLQNNHQSMYINIHMWYN